MDESVDASRLRTLLLARLHCAETMTLSALRVSLRPPLAGFAKWEQTVRDGLRTLVEEGLATEVVQRRTARYATTDAGRDRLRRTLGFQTLPDDAAQWKRMQGYYLLAHALCLPAPTTARARSRFSEAVQVAVLDRVHGLGLTTHTFAAARDALAWREFENLLGLDPTANRPRPAFRDGQARLLLARLLGVADTRLETRKLLTQLATRAVAAARPQSLKPAILRRWLSAGAFSADDARSASEPGPPQPPAPESAPSAAEPTDEALTAFASRVLAAAHGCPTGKPHGPDKVFISHVWRELRSRGEDGGLTEATFKERLARANNRGHLSLSRADLVEAFDPTDVAESTTTYMGSEYHFIRL